MAKQQNYFSLGIWVIVIAVLLFASLIFIGGRQWGQTWRSYTVRFPATYALPDEIKDGAQVFCSGALVGRVDQVELRRVQGDNRETPGLWAYLNIRILDLVELRPGCRIVARGPLLGGGGKLIIQDPGSGQPALPEDAVIDGIATGSVDQAIDRLTAELNPRNPAGMLALVKTQLDAANRRGILAKIHASLDDLNAITAQVARQLSPHQQEVLMSKLHQVLDNVNQTTAELRAQTTLNADDTLLAKVHTTLDDLNRGLHHAAGLVEENRASIHNTVLTLERTTDRIDRNVVGPVASELNLANTRGLLNQVHTALDKVNGSLADIEAVSKTARTAVVLNQDRFDQLMLNISEAAAQLKGASKDIRRNPWRLFYRPSLEESRQLNIFDAAREFSTASTRLEDSAKRLAALMETYGGQIPLDDPDLAGLCRHLEETFEDYGRAEEALWNELNIR